MAGTGLPRVPMLHDAPAALFLSVPSHPSYHSRGSRHPLLAPYPSSSLFLPTPSPAGSNRGGGGRAAAVRWLGE
uniref:Uncharacterized protein n=1 Tax=Aegilops tauschii TaxID=37682 RepID=N1QQL8_AEGTA